MKQDNDVSKRKGEKWERRALYNSFWLSILFQKSVSRSSCYEQKFAKATLLLEWRAQHRVCSRKGCVALFPVAINIFSRSWRDENHFEEREPKGKGRRTTTTLMSNMVTEHRPYPMLVFFNVPSSQTGGILDIRLSGCSHFRSASRVTILSIGRYTREREREEWGKSKDRMNDRIEWFVWDKKGGGGEEEWNRNGGKDEESKLRSIPPSLSRFLIMS